MKNLHAVRTETLLDFLEVCWPGSKPTYNPNNPHMIDFWNGERLENTMPDNSWDDWYAQWLAAGAPRDRDRAWEAIR